MPESSHQYSELYRLAGASGDRPLLQRVDRVIAGQARQGLQFDHDGSVHVRLARAQAIIIFGKARDALAVFGALEKCDLASANPASSTLRWRVRALDDLDHVAEADRVIATTMFPDPRHSVLVALDRAIRLKNWATANRQLTALCRIDPGPMRHLLEVVPKRIPARVQFVQRFYLY